VILDHASHAVDSSAASGEGGVGRTWAWTAAGAAALVLYRATMAPGLLWGDSGQAQLQVLLGGWYVQDEIVRSHVLYYALCRIAAWCGASAAGSANVIAALGGAVTVANFAWLAASLCRTRVAVAAATIALLLSHTHWHFSTGAEVVTLTTALLTAELIALVKLVETRRLRWVFLLALANGLGVSNHNFAFLMWPVYVFLALRFRRAWSGFRFRATILAAIGLTIGAAPVLALCVDHFLAHRSLGATVESFLVGHYAPNVANLSRLPQLLARTGLAFPLNFPTPLLLLGFIGVFAVRGLRSGVLRWALWLGGAIHLAFAARYDVPDQHTFLVPTFVFFALMMAVGLDRWAANRSGRGVFVTLIALACIAPIVYAAAPPLLRRFAPDLSFFPQRDVAYRDPYDWFIKPWRTGYNGPERFAREALAVLPPDALLVVDSTLYAPVNYVQAAESLRRDVRLDCTLAEQDWLSPITSDADAYRYELLRSGRLFAASDVKRYQPHWLRRWMEGETPVRFEPVGPVYKVVPFP
jgi:hypothetical protein